MRGIPKVTAPIFFSHPGNTNTTKFCTCAQDSYASFYKKFRANSTSFILALLVMCLKFELTLYIGDESPR